MMSSKYSKREKNGPHAGGAPTVQHVARMAGVSTATVSRAISHPDRVSQQTRAAVEEAIRKTGFVLNVNARNLRRGKAGAIVVILPNLGNPFFSRILAGIEQVFAGSGHSVLIADSRQSGTGQTLAYLSASRADGLIILDGSLTDDTMRRAAGELPPAVFACEWADGTMLPCVHIDNRGAAALAVEHLRGLGHARIGHLRGPVGNVLSLEREAGLRIALAGHGLAVREDWFLPGDFSLDAGIAAARAFLDLADRPTAFFSANDEMAFGFISELARHGVRVPGDVSIVGFDDIEVATCFIPPLTTIRQPREALGMTAARRLTEAMHNAGNRQGDRTVLPVELIVRGSTGPGPDGR